MSGRAWRGVLGVVLVLIAWEMGVRLLAVPDYLLPPVSAILWAVVRLRGELAGALLTTMAEALGGFGLSGAIGVGLAVLLVLVPVLRGAVVPLLVAVNAVPVVAYAPLALLWFGTGVASKLATVTFVVAFSVFVPTLAGLERADPAGLGLLRSFGAGRLGVLWRLRLPGALPLMMDGLRVATGRSVIIAIVTEMLGAYRGLGWTIFQAVLQIDFLRVWAAIFLASFFSLCFYALIGLVARRSVYWPIS